MTTYPALRLRRLRRTISLRNLVVNQPPPPGHFIWPVFVTEGSNLREPIAAMPGQSRFSVDQLPGAVEPVLAQGINSILLFGTIENHKDALGTYAHHEHGVVQQAIRLLRLEFPDIVIFTDVCLCAYTRHGHCGVLGADGSVCNDDTLPILTQMALSHAAAGADGVAPSAMMDGQVAAIREGLNGAGFQQTIIMSYSTKFASSMYGPFRDAAHSTPTSGDRRTYQAMADNRNHALLESVMDEGEGADILMVKPALFYLDIISALRARSLLPIAAYNVSGEYSMLMACADRGWGDLHAMVRESLLAIRRAGSDIIISYWANMYKDIFQEQSI